MIRILMAASLLVLAQDQLPPLPTADTLHEVFNAHLARNKHGLRMQMNGCVRPSRYAPDPAVTCYADIGRNTPIEIVADTPGASPNSIKVEMPGGPQYGHEMLLVAGWLALCLARDIPDGARQEVYDRLLKNRSHYFDASGTRYWFQFETGSRQNVLTIRAIGQTRDFS